MPLDVSRLFSFSTRCCLLAKLDEGFSFNRLLTFVAKSEILSSRLIQVPISWQPGSYKNNQKFSVCLF
jgi:hypothetical protein